MPLISLYFLDVYGWNRVAQQSVTKIISLTIVNLVTPKTGAKLELLSNEQGGLVEHLSLT
jgi:hypothetical protein